MDFNGTNAYVNIPDDPSLRLTGNATWIFWTFIRSLDVEEDILFKHYNYEFEILFRPDGQVRLNHGDGTYETVIVAPSGSIDLNVWTCWAITRDISSKLAYCYKNGVLMNPGGSSFTKTPVSSTHSVLIGRGETARYLDGLIPLVLMYNRVLSQEEILYIMLNYHNPIRDGLVLWLPFEEGRGTTVYDKSGNNNNGTIYNATWKKLKMWELRSSVGL